MITDYEQAHFIQPGTLVKLGWKEVIHDDRRAIEIPTANGKRWRFSDGDKPKYDQPVGYVACWYGLRRAADNARLWGLDFIVDCNGAASTIAADQHHVPAFSLQSGEGTRPKPELIAELKTIWQGKVIVAFDCDDPGRSGAIKRVQAYRDAGIEAEAVDLGLSIVGGDLADFVGVGGKLSECQRLVIPEPPKRSAPMYDRAAFAGWDRAIDEIKQRLSCYDLMIQRFGEPKKRGSKHGHWLAPQRTEDTASFCAYTGAGGWYDYGPGDGGDILDLIELLDNVPFGEAVRRAAGLCNVALPEPTGINPGIISIQKLTADWSGGLNQGERGAIIRYADRTIAILIDMAANAGQTFDIPYLICMSELTGISESAIRKAVYRLPEIFLELHAYIESDQIPEDLSLSSDRDLMCVTFQKCADDLRQRKAGRPSALYELAPREKLHEWILSLAIPKILKEVFVKRKDSVQLAAPVQAAFLEELGLDENEARVKAAELEKQYGALLAQQPGWRHAMKEVRSKVNALKRQLNDPRSAPLPADAPLNNRANMLLASMRAVLQILGGTFQISQAALCGLIGCRLNELASVCRAVGLFVDHHVYALREIVNWPDLMSIKPGFDPAYGGVPFDVKSSKGGRPLAFGSRKMDRWAKDQIIAQGKLTVRYRQANCYTTTPPVEPLIEVADPEPQIVQKPLFDADPIVLIDAFRAFWSQRLRLGLIARVYAALAMAWCIAKDVALHIERARRSTVKYAEAWISKVAGLVMYQEVIAADPTAETGKIPVQLAMEELLYVRNETKSPADCYEQSAGVGSNRETEPCPILSYQTTETTHSQTGDCLPAPPPKTTAALASSLSPWPSPG